MNTHRSIMTGIAPGIAIALAFGVFVAPHAMAEIVPKQLSGPPSEFAAMRAPDPVHATIHSHSALLPVDMRPAKSGAHWAGGLPVENGSLRFALFLPEDAPLDVTLTGPKGQKMRADSVAKNGVDSFFGMEGAQVPARMYSFDKLSNGDWSLDLISKSGKPTEGWLLLEGNPDTELASHATHARQLVGEPFALTAQMTGTSAAGKALIGPQAGRITRAELVVTGPDGSSTSYPMHDDGRHDDGAAGDGVYAAVFSATQSGDHVARVIIEGVDNAGNRIVRSAEHLLPFVDRTISVAGRQATAVQSKSATGRLSINIPVAAAKNAGHFRGFAEVWGRDAAGKATPVAWVGGMVTPESGSLNFGFDQRWVAKAGAQGPFELRNLRIEHPENFVTVAAQERMDLVMPRLRTTAKAADIRVDEMMTMGPRPPMTAQGKAAGRLLLVHGYCSGGVWPAAQFTNASSFLDVNQNRTHDAFARLIHSFGSSWDSYGAVAHSQGGAAALHLYTYYWSGFDNAVGSRLIQSVGTPYQGTNLAGILATLGNWFGVGCGTNSNLTYSGASAWLAGIPAWARAEVNYYTTSFETKWYRWDYCNAATDLVLSDPEDGTTEKVYGQLPGALNRGHTEGQCHTANMRDPAQYLDASRNAVMNVNAAR